MDLRDQLQMHLLDGQKTDVAAMNKVYLYSNIFLFL
jgi:hypothetical protein